MSTATLIKNNELSVADVQSRPAAIPLAINQVGIRDIKHPIKVKQKNGEIFSTIANCNMTITLDKNTKGTHMSRFVDILHREEKPFTLSVLNELLHTTYHRLNSNAAQLSFSFPYFLKKQAPISGVESFLDYQVRFFGEIKNNQAVTGIEVVVPVTSLCPCSKEISAYGAHNQRSHVTIRVHANGLIWVEDLINVVEKEASCQLYGLLKRVDEKFVTEYAYNNPKFVEDLVRDLATYFERDERISYYFISSENFESIHNHSAYAMIEKQKG